jgi:hypothetical protein
MSQIGQEALAHPGLRTLVAVRDHVNAARLAREVFAWAIDNKVPCIEVRHGGRTLVWPNGSVTEFTGLYTDDEAVRRYGAGQWQRIYLDPVLGERAREFLFSRVRSADSRVPVLGALNLDEELVTI